MMPAVQINTRLKKMFKVDPDAAWAAIQSVRVANGGLASPQKIVDAARANDSPLHDAFEWDNKRAAESYRREQARSLVQSFELVFESGRRLPAMVSVRVTDEDGKKRRGYMDTSEAMESADLRTQVLRGALGQLITLQEKYKTLSELSGIFASVGEAAADLGFPDLAAKSEAMHAA
jgi:hypothetical protein